MEDNSLITSSLIEVEALEAHKIFSNHVIKRTFPDYRDGLKPVQRRIIYAMHKVGCYTFVKSIRIVGEVIGKYHPHASLPVYEAMVKLAQAFNNNETIITAQGNFGSVDGDPAADARYTEVKLSSLSKLFLDYIDENVITWSKNFDDSLLEPDYLPCPLPLLLLNGIFGIGVGAMTSILPHNFGEIYESFKAFLLDSSLTLDDIMVHLKGPDFISGGYMLSKGIREIYETGIGSVVCRGKIDVEDGNLVITQVPFNVKISSLIKELSLQRKSNMLEMKEIIDESSMKDGIRVKINLMKGANIPLSIQKIFRYTSMQKSFSMNMLLMKDGKLKDYNLMSFYHDFKEYVIDLYTKRFIFQKTQLLKQKETAKLHIWCLENLESVLTILKSNKDLNAIKIQIISLGLDEKQTEELLNLRLYKLSSIEKDATEKKLIDLENKITEISSILSERNLLIESIVKILDEMCSIYKFNPRKTAIDAEHFLNKNNVPQFSVLLFVVNGKYVLKAEEENVKSKRLSTKPQNFKTDLGTPEFIFKAKNQDIVYFLTTCGRLFKNKVNDISLVDFNVKNISNVFFVNLSEEEKLCGVIAFSENEIENLKTKFVIFVTKKGKIAKISFSKFLNSKNYTKFLKYKDGDSLVSVFLSEDNENIFVASTSGKLCYFNSSEVRITSKNVLGVAGIKLKKNDNVISSGVVKPEKKVYLFTKNGLGKCIDNNSKILHRSTQGVVGIKLKNEDKLIKAVTLEDESFFLITNVGQLFRSSLSAINLYGRYAKGHKLIKLDNNSEVIEVV